MKALLALLIAGGCLAQTPELIFAAREGDIPRLNQLLAGKPDFTARGPRARTTALHEAALNCRVEVARLLINAGADKTALDHAEQVPGMVALECADPNARVILYQMLLVPLTPPGAPWTLEHAVAHGQVHIVKLLAGSGIDLNAVRTDGSHPLDVACLKGNTEIARILLEHGADPRLPNNSGSSPLHDAALVGNAEIVKLLLDHGSAINAVDRESGSTPLYFAASFGRTDAVRALLDRGADELKANRAGVTPFQAAVRNGHAEVEFLLRPGRR
jgi:ankyrin repeat protein